MSGDFCLLSDIFSQISDSSGVMMFAKFDQFLREVLRLPTAVFEGPSFGYTEHSVRTCFPQQVSVEALLLLMQSLAIIVSVFKHMHVRVCI